MGGSRKGTGTDGYILENNDYLLSINRRYKLNKHLKNWSISMGLIDFLKDVGADLFGGGKDEAEEITNLLTTDLGDKIKDLVVTFDDGVVTLKGECDTHATKEKAVLLAGNVKGVARVEDEELIAPEPEEETEYYTVVRGDYLSKIAKKFYGNASKYPVIFEANREVIKDPDLIYPGQKLRIPKL
jgi:nucleoid-associated protein YgaU